MRAAVVEAPNRVRVATVPVPEPGEGQVRVRIEGCGVCGSNLAPWEGRPWFRYPLAPGELGHEAWGVVDLVGPKAEKFCPGERVAMLSYRAYAEFDVAPETAVVALPSSLESKPFPGEALGCAINVFRRCDIQAGQRVAIVGIGFLGAVLSALSAGCGAEVIAISRRPFALEMASRLGAAHTIAMDEHGRTISEVKRLTDGQGCERVIEAVGQQWPLDLASEITRERGKLIIAGYHQDGPRQVNMQLWNWRGLDVINAHERDPRTYTEGIEAAVKVVESGQLDPWPLYTHTFQLEQISEAFDAMKERPPDFMKALVAL